MFSYYSLLNKNNNLLKTKTIFPQDIGYISFMQFIKLHTNKIYFTNTKPLYQYTDKRQDYILLNRGKLEITLINKLLDTEANIILNENSLTYNNEKIIDESILFNISSSVYYNIKPLQYSELLFYSSNSSNIGSDIEFNYYKLNKNENTYSKYLTEVYPYFDFTINEQRLIV